jgi:cytochrome c peroxidase
VLAGDREGQQVLAPQEVDGLRLFLGKGQCATCHNGPLFTDQHFHNTGVPPRDPARPDRGRAVATAKVQGDEFNCLGAFSDAPPNACEELRYMVSDDPALEGAFKTPSLRNVALRPPYMHAGQMASLEEVIAHYARSPKAALGHSELAHTGGGHAERKPIELSDSQARDLAAFLRTLSGASTPKQ